MRRDIIVWPDETLRLHGNLIDFTKFDPDQLSILVHDLMDTMWCAGQHAAGLAAIQIGDPYRLFLMRNEPGEVTVVANPEIIEVHGHPQDVGEGCLSFPGVVEIVQRYREITVKYDEINPATMTVHPQEKRLDSLEAHVFQHEAEHLNGMVLTDKLTPAKAKTIKNRLNKWKMKGYRHPPTNR